MGIALIPHREKLPTPLRSKKGKYAFGETLAKREPGRIEIDISQKAAKI